MYLCAQCHLSGSYVYTPHSHNYKVSGHTEREKGREFLIQASCTSLFDQDGWTPFLLLICKVYVRCWFHFRHVVIEVGPSYRPSLHFVLAFSASWVGFISLKVTWQPKQSRRFREQNPVEVVPNRFTGHQFIRRVKDWYTHGTVRSLVVYQDKHSNLLCLHMRGKTFVQCKFKDQLLIEVFYPETR